MECFHTASKLITSTWPSNLTAPYSETINMLSLPYLSAQDLLWWDKFPPTQQSENFIWSSLCCVGAVASLHAWSKSVHKGCIPDTILSVLRCPHSDNSSLYSIPPPLPATFKFNHSGTAVVQITLDSSTPSHYPGPNWILEEPRGPAWLN